MRNYPFLPAACFAFAAALTPPVEAFRLWGSKDDFRIRGVAEFGALAVLSHQIQFGRQGTEFDYVEQGGQDLLFPVSRFSLEMDAGKRNTFILLYQPLRLDSRVDLEEDAVFNDITFPASSSLETVYGFPFYRFSYLREITP